VCACMIYIYILNMDPTETTSLIDVVFVLPCLERDGNLARQIYMYTSQLVQVADHCT
jgi:hypothetical protein